MLEKLTKEQEQDIAEWREHCLQIGRDTSPINKELTEKSWKKFYKMLGKKEPKFWYCQSPLQAQIIINIFPKIQKMFQLKDKGDNIRANIWANIWANIVANISANIRANIVANISANIRANIWANISANIWANIWANIEDNISANIRAIKFKYIDTYSWCQHDIAWIAYYKYYEKYGLLPNDKNFEIFDTWYDLACSCGWCYTFENMVFVCEKPCELHINEKGQLNKDGDMALKYSDGYGLYMLNGIRVPEWCVTKKAEKITVKEVLSEKNVDIQRELIRKVGADRILKDSGASKIDIYKDDKTGLSYTLYHMKLNDRIDRKYLYFEHASVKGIFYCQPVPPETRKALHGYAWQRRLVERNNLNNITIDKEAELIANLPERVS